MFHFVDNDVESKSECKKLIKKSFVASSSTKNKDILYKTDFKCAWLYLFGYKISKLELQEYFERLGKNYYHDGISYEEFEKKALCDISHLDIIEELRNCFISIDFSCKGFLTIDDMIKQFKIAAPHISKNTIMDIFREMDRDDDGRISYKDFELAMQYIDDVHVQKQYRHIEEKYSLNN
ncbi:EF-hand calcium-binding domain-containing 11-like [Brachionus plicatilis]|uniref:EF-hand calcium-binding domain-containing 11-like n=1 Tax=Brachionus plicatilis TaxID=10195 RepID=A0A3M7PCN3_BRAPC|nr:EF-hand calcium-binding domain-containing 11-like [Brachionus plicatilis]